MSTSKDNNNKIGNKHECSLFYAFNDHIILFLENAANVCAIA